MTTLPAAAVMPASSGLRSRAPWPVIAAFYLWWPLVVAQAVGLAYMGFTFDQAARIGGPAWDILFIDVPIGVPTLALTVLEIAFLVRLRDGNRAARIWLAALAIPAATSVVIILAPVVRASLTVAASVTFTLTHQAQAVQIAVLGIGLAAFAAAISAAVLPFIPPVGRFFWKPPRAGSSSPEYRLATPSDVPSA